MNGLRVVAISDVFRLDEAALGRLAAAGFDPVARHDLVHSATSNELRAALQGAFAVIAGSERYDAAVLSALPALRAVARPGVGYDAIDVNAAKQHGIAVLITPGANDEAVADHTLALMLAVCRRLVEHDQAVRRGAWRAAPPGRDLSGATVGIVGLGSIGRAVATRLQGFGCRLLSVEPKPDLGFCERLGIEIGSLSAVAPKAEFLTVHVPSVPGTVNLIDREVLESLPTGAIVVNTARGPIVNEVALIDGLRSGHLAGAGLDVFSEEPIKPGHPLLGLPTVVLSPHVAAFSREAIRRMADATIANLIAVRDGRTPSGAVAAAGLRPAVPMPPVGPAQ